MMIRSQEEGVLDAVEALGRVGQSLRELSKEVEDAKLIVEKMRETLAFKEKEIKERDGKIISLEEMVKSKEEAAEKLKLEAERLRRLLEEKTGEVARLKEKMGEIMEDVKSKDEELTMLREENERVKAEMEAIQEQLLRISKMYREITKERERVEDVRQLLSIYITLLEEVFAGQPHAKVLYILHGAKSSLKRNELTKTAGFQPAVILKSIHDLANAKLVEYDMEKDEVKLVRRIY